MVSDGLLVNGRFRHYRFILIWGPVIDLVVRFFGDFIG